VYDGGVYDNLGLEPFFDAGKQLSKGNYQIIASDAGRPLGRGFNFASLNPFRLNRLMDIVTDQTRALRVRTFAQYLMMGGSGAYLQIGAVGRRIIEQSGKSVPSGMDLRIESSSAETAKSFPTDLHCMSCEMFDLLERHGYEAAMANHTAYPYL